MPEPLSTIKVILVDDYAVVRAGTRLFLERSGEICIIGEAADGDEAMPLIEQLQPDVVVLDLDMPRMSGLEVTRLVRLNGWRVGILILSSRGDAAEIGSVLKAGANGYVLKSAQADEIAAAVRDVFQGESALDAASRRRQPPTIPYPAQGTDVSWLLRDPPSGRELEILGLVAKGLTNKAISVQLGISDRTVQGHIARIFEKLKVASRTEAVMRSISLGLLASPEPVKDDRLLFDI